MPENAPLEAAAPNPYEGAVLVVDDELAVVRVYQRALAHAGYHVITAGDGAMAEVMFRRMRPACVVTDQTMPGTTGLHLLRTLHAIDPDVPVIVVTGEHDEQLACQVAAEGALALFHKPVPVPTLVQMVAHAARLAKAAEARRARAKILDAPAPPPGAAADAGLATRFERALATLWVAFRPVMCWAPSVLVGFEALARSGEPTLADPASLFDAAEQLGRASELGRAIRARVAERVPYAPEPVWISLNLHVAELLDEELYTETAPLRAHSDRIIFEVSEREPLDRVADLEVRVDRLRHRRYRLALDDWGATHDGLSSLARLKPTMVKIDASLVRNIDRGPIHERIVMALVALTRSMGVDLVADGVETAEEAQTLGMVGCTLQQGAYYGTPGRGFA